MSGRKRRPNGELAKLVYSSIRAFKIANGYSPSLEQVAEDVGVAKNTVFRVLDQLIEMGLVVQDAFQSRSIRLTGEHYTPPPLPDVFTLELVRSEKLVLGLFADHERYHGRVPLSVSSAHAMTPDLLSLARKGLIEKCGDVIPSGALWSMTDRGHAYLTAAKAIAY